MLLELPVDQIVLRWVNHILKPLSIGRVMKNYTTNLQDSEIIYTVLISLFPEECKNMSQCLVNKDWDLRAREIIDLLSYLKIPPIVSVESIVNGAGDLNLCLLSYLLLHYSTFSVHDEYKTCLIDLEDLSISIKIYYR